MWIDEIVCLAGIASVGKSDSPGARYRQWSLE
jgi:hypothetical protein